MPTADKTSAHDGDDDTRARTYERARARALASARGRELIGVIMTVTVRRVPGDTVFLRDVTR